MHTGGIDLCVTAGVAASAVATRPIRSSVKFYNPDALKKDKKKEGSKVSSYALELCNFGVLIGRVRSEVRVRRVEFSPRR